MLHKSNTNSMIDVKLVITDIDTFTRVESKGAVNIFIFRHERVHYTRV